MKATCGDCHGQMTYLCQRCSHCGACCSCNPVRVEDLHHIESREGLVLYARQRARVAAAAKGAA